MNAKKIDLGVAVEALRLSIRTDIERAIVDENSVIEIKDDYVKVNGLTLIRNTQGSLSLVMNFDSPKILKILEPTNMEIRNKIAELSAQIEELKTKL